MMDVRQIQSLLPHRFPFLLVDRVEEVEPGQRVVALKCVTVNEPFFQGHFPGQPVMPGVLLVEAMAQVSALVAITGQPQQDWTSLALLGVDRFRFRRPVVPGDRLRITCHKLWERRAIWRFAALAEVEGVRVASGEITATFAPEQP